MAINMLKNIRTNWPAWAFGAVLAGLLLWIYWDVFAWALQDRHKVDVEDEFFEPQETTPLLILPVAGWLFWSRIRSIRETLGHGGVLSRFLGSALLVGSCVLIAWFQYVSAQPWYGVITLIGVILGSGLLFGGWALFRELFTPSVFLLLAFPLPAVIVNAVIYPLQLVAADLTAEILPWLGVKARLMSDQILTPGKIFLVIETCSGFRSIQTMIMAGILYVELFYRNRTQMWILLIAAPVIAFWMNIVRILTIVLNPAAEIASVHTIQGLLVLVVSILILHGLNWVIERFQGETPASPRPQSAPELSPSPARRSAAALLLGALFLAALVASAVPPWAEPLRGSGPYVRIQQAFDGWHSRNLPVDLEFFGTVSFLARIHKEYARGSEKVDFFVAIEDRLRSERSLISEKHSVPGSGWSIESSVARSLDGGIEATELVIRSVRERRLAIWWVLGTDSTVVESIRALAHLDRGPWMRWEDVVVVRASTRIDEDPAQARERLDAFLAEALPRLEIIPRKRGNAE